MLEGLLGNALGTGAYGREGRMQAWAEGDVKL